MAYIEESNEGAVIVAHTFILLTSDQNRNCHMDELYIAIFRHLLRKVLGEISAMYSGLQTRASEASLPSNEKLFLMRLLITRVSGVHNRKG